MRNFLRFDMGEIHFLFASTLLNLEKHRLFNSPKIVKSQLINSIEVARQPNFDVPAVSKMVIVLLDHSKATNE